MKLRVLLICLCGYASVLSAALAEDAAPGVIASIDTTLSTAEQQIKQFAFDGDSETLFVSTQNPTASDHFTLVFEKPVAVSSIKVTTGRAAGEDKLSAAALEVSADGKAFEQLVKFADGAATAAPNRQVQAVRIKPDADMQHPLALRELAIESDPPLVVFKYPIEFLVDVSDSPDMQEWADKAARACERAYPMINEELKSDGYKPPHFVTMTLKSSYRGVAAASGTRITGSVRFFKEHPDDIGAMVHETCHVVQRYGGRRGNPGWLVEGVADYVRFFKYEPGNIGPINAERARYDRSYRVTAAFLAYLVDKYDKDLVKKLNQAMREGKYKEEMFKEMTGKTVQDLDAEWRTSLKPAAAG